MRTKKLLLFCITLVLLSPVVLGQRRLYFPRLEGNVEDEFVGIAFASQEPATIRCTVFDEGGADVASRNDSLGPRQQVARLGRELFGSQIAGRRLWMMAEASSSSVTSFFMNGNNGLDWLDGAVALTDADLGKDVFVPMVLNSSTRETEITIVNPNSAPAIVNFQKILTDTCPGCAPPPPPPSPPSFSITISPRGKWQRTMGQATAEFPNFPVVEDGAYRLTANMPILAHTITFVKENGRIVSLFALPGVNVSTAANYYVFPFAVVGKEGSGPGFRITVDIYNVSRTIRDPICIWGFDENYNELKFGGCGYSSSTFNKVRFGEVDGLKGKGVQRMFIVLEGALNDVPDDRIRKTPPFIPVMLIETDGQITAVPPPKPSPELIFSHKAQSKVFGMYDGLSLLLFNKEERIGDPFVPGEHYSRLNLTLPVYTPKVWRLKLELFNSAGSLMKEKVIETLDRRINPQLISEIFGVEEAVGGHLRVTILEDPKDPNKPPETALWGVNIFGGAKVWSIIPPQTRGQAQ